MHGDRGTVRDVLPGHVLDVGFERVDVRHAGVELRRQVHGYLAAARRLRFPAHHRRLVARALDVADELPAIAVRERVVHRLRRGEARRAGPRPRRRPARHRRAEQVLRRHRAFHLFAGLHRRARHLHVDAEVRPAIRRHQEVAVHRLLVGDLVVGLRARLVARTKLLGLLRLGTIASSTARTE